MAGSNFEEGIKRAKGKETNTQRQGRGQDAATKKKRMKIGPGGINPTSGGHIKTKRGAA